MKLQPNSHIFITQNFKDVNFWHLHDKLKLGMRFS